MLLYHHNTKTAAGIRRSSPWGKCAGWRLVPVIVKSHDDLRQEQLAAQLLWTMHNALAGDGFPEALRPYDILALSADAGSVMSGC